jgi:serine/threonine protein kinase
VSDAIRRLNAVLEGRYRIEREVGEGGMATVYLAADVKHSRKVALKVLKPNLAAVVGAERFLSEIEVTANLQHPHILPLFDSGEADGFLFYVMPYIDGETLAQRIERERQLSVEEAVSIATAVANALQVAHDQGVVHRDVKPANILLSRGEPVIADFGIALAVGAAGGGRLTETGLSLGTPHYMSPEQATGDAHVGPAADIYALGCVLYEMLVGEPPFTGSTLQAVLGKIIMGTPDRVTEHRSTVPSNVEAAIDKALERVPADRFRGASEFSRALADPGFRHGDPTASALGAGRTNGVSIGLAGLAIVMTFAAAWGWLRTPPAGPPPHPIQGAILFPSDSGPENDSWLAVSPDGTRLAYSSTPGLDGGRIWIQSLENGQRTPLADTENGAAPSWSPAGDRIAFRVPDREIRIVSTEGGPVTTVAAIPAGVGVPHWGKDDRIYFTSDGDLWSVPVSGGEPSLTLDGDWDLWENTVISTLPDGRGVLFGAWVGGERDVILGDLTTGQYEVLVEDAGHPMYADGWIIFRQGSATVAHRFDPDSRALQGPAVPLAGGIPEPGGHVQFTVSSNTFVHMPRKQPNLTGGFRLASRDGASASSVDGGPGWMRDLARDGSRVVSGGNGLWITDMRGGLPRQLDGVGSQFVYFPRLSGDGTRVLYGAQDGLSTIETTAGGTPTVLVPGENVRDHKPVGWGPDGEVLFIEFSPDGSSALRVLETGGAREAQTLLPGATDAYLSPDGRWIAYVSEILGRVEVSIRAYRGTDEIRISSEGGLGPSWGPSGDEVFFVTPADQAMVSSLSFENGISASPPRPVLSNVTIGNGEDVFLAAHPDGRLLHSVRAPAHEWVSFIRDWQALATGGGAPN